MNLNLLFEKIDNNTSCVGVIGLGYVGLPLALAFSKKFHTIGFDVNEKFINLIEKGLQKVKKNIYGSTIAFMGPVYKKNINDTRESPSAKIIGELVNLGAKIKVFDPFTGSITTKEGSLLSEKCIEDTLKESDCSVFITDHDLFKELDLGKSLCLMRSPVIIDCKNLFNELDGTMYLGIVKGD
jgi:UDP-N-acetyl-D-glucosamine dehydrogenase